MYHRRITSILLSIIISGFGIVGIAKSSSGKPLSKPATLEYQHFAENEIANWFGNDGHLTTHMLTGGAGCEWPAGSGNTVVYAAGIWVAGKIGDEVRSAAAEFSSEWKSGRIPYDTETKMPTSDSPVDTPLDQIYFIHDWNSSDPNSSNYNWEYANWPASVGAPAHDGELFKDLNANNMWDTGEPYEDFNQSGTYDGPDGNLITGEDPPLFKGDDMAWYVMNDWSQATHANLWSTLPLGLELHVLTYTIDRGPLFDKVQFNEMKLINKGGVQIDSTFFAYWSDVDLGSANDDQIGCDTLLSMAYYYNGDVSDQDYGLRPPAVGYDFLQGPIVDAPGESVWIDGEEYSDKKLLNMTAVFGFVSSSAAFGDPENSQEAFYIMQGLSPSGILFHDPWGNITTYLLPGDPVAPSGWVASDFFVPSDKRQLMTTGPFTLPPWDDTNSNNQADFGEPGVQVIHGALEIIGGANNLDAITNLKYLSETIQYAFDTRFNEFEMSNLPEFTASAYDLEIVLNWHAGSSEHEATSWGDYQFEGYEIYQGATSDGPWVKLMSFDLNNEIGVIEEERFDEYGILQTTVIHFGENSGLQHLISIREDALTGGQDLVNGQEYHFSLKSYAYSDVALPNSIESVMQVVSVQPQENEGSYDPQESLLISHTGNAEVAVEAIVLDPSLLTGENYELGFDFDQGTSEGSWHLLKVSDTSNDTLMQSPELISGQYVDGFELSIGALIFEAPRVNHDWEQTVNIEGNTSETLELLAVSPGGVDSLAWSDASMTSMVHLDSLFGPGNPYDFFIIDDRLIETWFILSREIFHDVRIYGFASNFGALGGDRLADIPNVGGGSENIEFLQADLEIRFTEAGQMASLWDRAVSNDPFPVHIPYEVWDIERNIQLCVALKDNNQNGGNQDTTLEDWEHTLDLDWVTIFDLDYAFYGDSMQVLRDNPNSGWCWQFHYNSRFTLGDVLHLSFINPVISGEDIYTWTTAGLSNIEEPPGPDDFVVKDLKIYPNPFNPSTTIHYGLPKAGKLRIDVYDLLGRNIWSHQESAKPAGYYSLVWTGRNQLGQLAASGVYLIRISTPEFSLVQKAVLIR